MLIDLFKTPYERELTDIEIERTLVNDVQQADYYTVTWDGQDNSDLEVPSGIYFYRLRTDDFTATKRMILMK